MEWSFVWCINPGAKKHYSRCSWWIVVQSNLLQKTYCQYHPRSNHIDWTTDIKSRSWEAILFFGDLPQGKKHPVACGFVFGLRTLWLPYRKIWLSWLKSSRIYSLWRPGKEGWNCFCFFFTEWMNLRGFFWVFQDCHADSFFSNRGILEGWFNMIIWSSFWLLKIPIGKVSPMMASEMGEVVDRNGNRQLSQLLRRVQTFLRHFNFVQLLGASIDCQELHRFCFFWQQKAENCDQLWSTIFTIDLRPKCFPDGIFSQVLVMNQALQIHHWQRHLAAFI